jgi:hypothetical protein
MPESTAVLETLHLLRAPRQRLRQLDAAGPTLAGVPPVLWRSWGVLAALAVAGSCVYGASLGLALPRRRSMAGALWLASAVGLGWCAFGPALVWATGRRVATCVQACLVTMAYGESVLAFGAAANVAGQIAGGPGSQPAHGTSQPIPRARTAAMVRLNVSIVALANGVMAAALAAQLRAAGVPVRKTLLLWVTVLDGSGALAAWMLRRLLFDDVDR